MIRTAHHRLVRFPALPPLLYDLADDPAETTNRADDPTLASTLDDLMALANVDAPVMDAPVRTDRLDGPG